MLTEQLEAEGGRLAGFTGERIEMRFGRTRLVIRTERPAPGGAPGPPPSRERASARCPPRRSSGAGSWRARRLPRKLAPGNGGESPDRISYDVTAAARHDPQSLRHAANLLGPMEQAQAAMHWHVTRTRIEAEAKALEAWDGETALETEPKDLVDEARAAV